MKIVGLTGGIGSGKTTVALFFEELGVPVYIADDEAKSLANRSKVIKRKLIHLLGEESYKDSKLDRKFVANRIFKDAKLLEQVNAIIHPRVAMHFKRWIKKQKGPYCIKEAAILFENGGYKNCDLTILVTAPVKTRIERILDRDNTTIEAIKERMDNQWKDSKKIKLADIVIENTSLKATKEQVKEIHLSLLKELSKSH